MSVDPLLRRYRDAAEIPWENPPPELTRAVCLRPGDAPVPAPAPGPQDEQVLPPDVRGYGTAAATDGTIISRSFPGVDVTMTVVPPRGDGLWTVRGRAWRHPATGRPLRLVLSWGSNVLGDQTAEDGGAFEFHELLLPGWALEIHLDDGRAVVLRAPSQ